MLLFYSVGDSRADMKAAVWGIPQMNDTVQSDDNSANAPSLELHTNIDNSQYGDVKGYWFLLHITLRHYHPATVDFNDLLK